MARLSAFDQLGRLSGHRAAWPETLKAAKEAGFKRLANLRRHASKLLPYGPVEKPASDACEWDGADMRSTEIVTAFWGDVWNAHEPDAVDRFVADDVIIEAGGQEIAGKDNIKNWVKQFLDHVNDLHVDTIETFQNGDGTRVTSRWVLTGTNNGILGTEPNGKPIAMTGTAVWTVDEGKLQRGWVEQASFELYHWLLAK